jgi:hypothetical protein
MINQCYQLNLFFSEPEPNFDRSKVKGKLFQLFRIKDKIHEKAL